MVLIKKSSKHSSENFCLRDDGSCLLGFQNPFSDSEEKTLIITLLSLLTAMNCPKDNFKIKL